MDNVIAEAVEMYGSLKEALPSITSTGILLRSFSHFSPGTDYIAFAAGLDEDGTVNTEIAGKEFTTEETISEVTFDLNFTNIYWDGMDFTLTPSDKKFTYHPAIRPAFQYDELSDADLLEKISAEDGMKMHYESLSGTYGYSNDSEEEWRCSDTGYIVIVFR